MRLVDIVIASLILGLAIGHLQTGLPGSGTQAGGARVGLDCAQAKCERVTWLRTPAMRRTYSE